MERRCSIRAIRVALGAIRKRAVPAGTKPPNPGLRHRWRSQSCCRSRTATFSGVCNLRQERSIRGAEPISQDGRFRTFSGGVTCSPTQHPSFEDDCAVVEECSALINARLDIPSLKSRLLELNEAVADPKLYEDSTKAAKLVKERSRVEAKLLTVENLASELAMWREMYEMALLEGEESVKVECVEKVGLLRRDAERARAEALLALGGNLSSSNCYLEVQAGAGGTESHDWTSILLKMYTKWAERRGFTVTPVNTSPGEEAGLRTATVLVEGDSVYGWLRSEAGVHRLVRNSPFDPGQRRHTSFAQVRIYPEADASGEARQIDVAAKDLKVETMRAQGAGGQHVNTTDSAVRITHLPTGLVATSQSDRSQHRNKDSAMRVLRAKMSQMEEEKRLAKRNEYTAGLGDNAFGNQIRSYVLTPYQLVKDHRTAHQDADVAAVLAGEINSFIESALVAEHMGADRRDSHGNTGLR